MADNAHGGHADSGSMDMKDHVETWHSFTKGVKWSIIGLVIIAVILFIFRTHG